jgi:hypothetical protein
MVNSGEDALTVLIHLGYLGYDPETSSCYVPNREIAEELVRATREIKWDTIYGSKTMRHSSKVEYIEIGK